MTREGQNAAASKPRVNHKRASVHLADLETEENQKSRPRVNHKTTEGVHLTEGKGKANELHRKANRETTGHE